MKYDVIILGSGPGGYVAAIRASQLGLNTAIVEKENLGGVCLNWGCIPTKALIKSAQVFEYLQHAEDYGLKVSSAKVDFTKVIGRSRDVASAMSKGVQFLMKKNKITVIDGYGRLARGKKVEVEQADGSKQEVSADHIIVATGARARALPHIEIDHKSIIGYREAMTLKKQPKRMVVIGAGAIGVEFAYFYSTLGTEVTIVEFLEQGLLPREDKDISKELGKIFKKKGINVVGNASVEGVTKKGSTLTVSIKSRKNDSISEIECDIVLSATGVATNIEDIGLETLGIKTDKGHILVDDYYQTNVPGIYAIGDVVPGPALAHVASAEGIICIEKIAGHHPAPLDYGNIPSCTYCSPEVASVGMTEADAKAAGYEIKLGKFPFSVSGKAKAAGTPEGFVKVIYDAKYGELLGAHLIGANVTEMIAEIVVSRKLETTGLEMVKTVHPHPTMSEAIMEASAMAYGEVIHL
ncbi:MAG: dihydrolipoamide dehydrogenase [Saprospiraceae bacterium]|jgi:dihydrolipoamide dehydrogenase